MSIVRWVAVFGLGAMAFGSGGCSAADDGDWGEQTGSQDLEVKGGKKCGNPNWIYVSRDPSVCAAVHFSCAEGTPFFNNCGCGCDTSSTPCGPNTCGAGQVCCNASCGICTAPGEFCTQQACEPI